MSHSTQPPWYYWLIAIAGLFLFVMPAIGSTRAFIWPETLDNFPELHREFILAGPTWWRLSMIVATVATSATCVALLLRSTLAVPLSVVALSGAVLYFFYEYVLVDVIAVFGLDALFEPLVVLSLLSGLVWFSFHSKNSAYFRR